MLQTAFWNTAIFRGFLLGTFSWFKFNFPFRLVFIWWLSFSPVEKYVQVLKAWLSVVLTWLWSPSELHLDRPQFSESLKLPRDVPGLCQMIHQLLHALVLPCQAPSVPCLVRLPASMPTSVERNQDHKWSDSNLRLEQYAVLQTITFAIANIPRAFLLPCLSSWSAASNTNNLVLSSSIRHWRTKS